MTTDQWITVFIGGGGALLFQKIIAGVWKWFSGWQRAERDALQELETERRYRAAVEEQLYFMRAQMIQKGHQEELPPFPERKRFDPDAVEPK